MLLNIIPVNVLQPFIENNTPQIVVLALLTGVALLLLGEKTKGLNNMLHEGNDLFMKVMNIVLKITPVVPFLSIAILVAQGKFVSILEGWKFIAAAYLVFTICLVFKMIKTKAVTGKSSLEILKKSKAAIKTGFTTGSTAAPIQDSYDAAEKELHIKPEFTYFWVPMCSAMLALKTTVNVVLATFMMTELLGMTISTSYVGLFSTYRVFIYNYSTAAIVAYDMLELYERAYKMDMLQETEE